MRAGAVLLEIPDAERLPHVTGDRHAAASGGYPLAEVTTGGVSAGAVPQDPGDAASL